MEEIDNFTTDGTIIPGYYAMLQCFTTGAAVSYGEAAMLSSLADVSGRQPG